MDEMDEDGLPIWPAAERNKQPILNELMSLVPTGHGTILEVSAATGQHALHFAPHFPGYNYYVSDCDPEHLSTLLRRIQAAGILNLLGPLRLDTTDEMWPLSQVDVVYNANMMHIAPWEATVGLFHGSGRCLRSGGLLITYGPYRLEGRHNSESNERFDASLRVRNPQWGVRDLDELVPVAERAGLQFIEKRAMPANNFLLVWSKS